MKIANKMFYIWLNVCQPVSSTFMSTTSIKREKKMTDDLVRHDNSFFLCIFMHIKRNHFGGRYWIFLQFACHIGLNRLFVHDCAAYYLIYISYTNSKHFTRHYQGFTLPLLDKLFPSPCIRYAVRMGYRVCVRH